MVTLCAVNQDRPEAAPMTGLEFEHYDQRIVDAILNRPAQIALTDYLRR